MPNVKTASGKLSAYGFACGYVQSVVAGGLALELYHEGCVFHVRLQNRNVGKRVFWRTFETLGEARREYAKARRYIQKRHVRQNVGKYLAASYRQYKTRSAGDSFYLLKACKLAESSGEQDFLIFAINFLAAG